ncbi:unnamed protein product [Parascedosporium putredinis]|uniref:Extracellular serine-rich protein n=1 Tax=Parascedosporium putredinis TaxID=1442378 RepID=A0A9P1HCE6_9PEZI|nr:unnamed protein product [Parascedosporium putredinis]CAI8004818.1 unnamed protein product [Parascedosporium putredinis]
MHHRGEDNKFSPETVTADKGDVLEFHFGPKNHSVAMGEFDSVNGPCVPANEGGFFSGYFAVDSGESDKVFRVQINDTEPIVFYSTQDNECSEGMIGAVNLASNDDLNEYREKASSLSRAVAPPPPTAASSVKVGLVGVFAVALAALMV